MYESIHNAIKEVEKKYNFLPCYDLPDSIKNLVKFHHSLTALRQNALSNKELRGKLKKLIKIANKMAFELNDTPEVLRDYVNTFLNSILPLAKYPSHKIWDFSDHLFRSKIILSAFEFSLSQMQHKKGGRKPTSIRQDIIDFLVDIFREGTGCEPECKHNGYDNTYSGLIYEFILDIEAPLEKLGVENLGNDKSIGKSLLLSINEHRKIPKNKLLVSPLSE